MVAYLMGFLAFDDNPTKNQEFLCDVFIEQQNYGFLLDLLVTSVKKHSVYFLLAQVVRSVDDKQGAKYRGNLLDRDLFEISKEIVHHVDKLINSLLGLLIDDNFHEQVRESLHEL